MASFSVFLPLTAALLLFLSNVPSLQAQLSPTFYDTSCPNLASTVRSTIDQAVANEARMAASLVRLHFHDCFVMGCDASVLLNETSDFQSEKDAIPNRNSARGFEVIDAAKLAVENICPGVVSCADILALAARDASVAAQGPTWTVRLGRRDSTIANITLANSDLPLASSDLATLIRMFDVKGLNERDMVALSGAHTIGQARCITFRNHIYRNQTFIDPDFAATRRAQCPDQNGNGDGNLAPLDLVTPNTFDNNYFVNLQQGRGLLNSDQVLFNNGSADVIVFDYVTNPQSFNSDFAAAMVKMSEISPLLGSQGIIRRVCSAPN